MRRASKMVRVLDGEQMLVREDNFGSIAIAVTTEWLHLTPLQTDHLIAALVKVRDAVRARKAAKK
jgi:hypothetical protein